MRIQWFSFIRVLGVILVLVYHFFRDALPGGFFGVDIFFTFSGYLITALLIDEFARDRKIDLVQYLRRRFYRIFPPLALTILTTIPFALLIRKDFLASIGQQIVAALGFVTNFYEISVGTGYEAQFAPHLLLHTWSLGVEVQFYLLWGVLLWLMAKFIKDKSQYRFAVGILSGELAIVSIAALALGLLFKQDLSALYFNFLSHSFPLFVGGALASFVGIREKSDAYERFSLSHGALLPIIGFLLSIAGLIGMALVFKFDAMITYQIGFYISTALTALMILSARLMHDALPGLNEPRIITYIANISYGIYLFHWPILTISKELTKGHAIGFVSDHVIAVIITTILSIALSTLSFYLVEPILMGKSKLKGFWAPSILLTAVSLFFIFQASTATANVGPFEQNMTQKGLQQAATRINNTRLLVDGSSQEITAHPTENYDNVMIIGDSVALDAVEIDEDYFQDAIVDNRESRPFSEAREIIQEHLNNGSLREFTVLAVGVNSLYGYEEELQSIIELIPEDYKLMIVTPYTEDEYKELGKNLRDYELTLPDKYDNVMIADWYQTAIDHPELWEGSDGYHFSHTAETMIAGAKLYLDTIRDALPPASGDGSDSDNQEVISESALVIGDSVMIDAGDKVEPAFPSAIVDYRANRDFTEVNSILDSYASNGSLPSLVVVAVGVNEDLSYQDQLDEIVEKIPDGGRLVLITPYNGSYSDNPDSNVAKEAAYERKLAKKYDFVTVGDWAEVAASHPEVWEDSDYVHFSNNYDLLDQAANYYTETIVSAAKSALKAGTK